MDLTAEGLVIDTVDEIVEAISTTLKNEIDPNLDTNPETAVLGQIIGIIAEREHHNQQILRELYQSNNPGGASGQALAQLALITGTVKRDATRSTVVATVNLNGGTLLAAGARANVAGVPDAQFETLTDVENTGGAPADFPVAMRAVEVGPVRANAGTLTEITTPSVGWNSVTNALDAELGLSDETDPELRLRREQELRVQGSAALDAIVADVEAVDGVVAVVGRENTDDEEVDGVPPRSFEIVVWDGVVPAADDDEIAQAIWDAKPAGVRSSGNESGEATDRQDSVHTINFGRATQLEMYLEIDITIDPDTFPAGGDDLVTESVITEANTRWTIGADVVPSALYGAVFTRKVTNEDGSVTHTPIPGVTSVSAIRQNAGSFGGTTDNRVVAFSEIAVGDTSRVSVYHV